MDNLLADRCAVVTGAMSGNGRAIARRFAEQGADVVVADIVDTPREGGEPTHHLIESETDQRATYVECDVSRVDDLAGAVETAQQFGGVDVMVNNAAIFQLDEFPSVDEPSFDRMMAVNVKGPFFGAQEAARQMLSNSRKGSIINVSSAAGLEGKGRYILYCTTKGAVRLMTYALADRLGSANIRVNAIHPGLVETQMTTDDLPVIGNEDSDFVDSIPLGRPGDPSEVADAALYLASDLSSFVTGESLVVDGGTTSTG